MEEDISDILNDTMLSAEDKQLTLQTAYVTFVTASQPGWLPDYIAAFAMDIQPDHIREEILDRIEEAQDDGDDDDSDDEIEEWEKR